MNKKVLWVIIAVVIVAAILILGGGKTNAPTSNTGNLPAVTADNSTPDAIVNSLTTFSSDMATTPVESDPTLTATDQQSMSALSQSFDPNQIPNQ
jgi:hypothetical protein